MIQEHIVRVGIDLAGRLYIRPRNLTFPHIGRAALEVRWDDRRGVLYTPAAREWSHLDWYRHVLVAVDLGFDVRLKVDATTFWSNVPERLRSQIIKDQAYPQVPYLRLVSSFPSRLSRSRVR